MDGSTLIVVFVFVIVAAIVLNVKAPVRIYIYMYVWRFRNGLWYIALPFLEFSLEPPGLLLKPPRPLLSLPLSLRHHTPPHTARRPTFPFLI